jgi:filamentous hemagglutinin
VVEGKTLAQLFQQFNIPSIPSANTLSNYKVRIWYKYTKANIENVIDKKKSLELQAKQAFNLRNTYRSNARDYMQDRKLAEYLQQNEVNEVWENFIQTTSIKTGKTGDALWSEIRDKSMHGRERVDELFKLDGL